MSKRLVLLILSLTLLTSCGFKLRGNFEMSPALSQISIEGGNRLLRDELTLRLEQSESAVVDAASGIPAIVITQSDYERVARTTDASGRATGYDFIYTVSYNVTDGEGGILEPVATISQQRTLDYDPNEELQAAEEEEFLREEMEEEIVLQILRRLSRI